MFDYIILLSQNQRTPAHAAANFGHVDILKTLYQHDAKLSTKDKVSFVCCSWYGIVWYAGIHYCVIWLVKYNALVQPTTSESIWCVMKMVLFIQYKLNEWRHLVCVCLSVHAITEKKTCQRAMIQITQSSLAIYGWTFYTVLFYKKLVSLFSRGNPPVYTTHTRHPWYSVMIPLMSHDYLWHQCSPYVCWSTTLSYSASVDYVCMYVFHAESTMYVTILSQSSIFVTKATYGMIFSPWWLLSAI